MRTLVTVMSGLTVVALAIAGVALWRVEIAEAARGAETPARRDARDESGALPEARTHIVEAPLPVPVETIPAVAPTPAPVRRIAPTPAPARAGELGVRRLIVATGVEAREPVGAATTFARADATRLYAFVEASNRSGSEQTVVVTFEPEHGDAVGHVELEVGNGARWRTWAYTRMMRAGSWDAVVRDTEGRELARTSFEITE